MPLPGQAGPPTEYVPGAVAVLPSHALPSPPPGRPPSRNAAPQQRTPSPPQPGGGGGEMAEAVRRLTYEVAEERARSAGLRGEAEMLRHESAVRLAQERAESAKLRAEVEALRRESAFVQRGHGSPQRSLAAVDARDDPAATIAPPLGASRPVQAGAGAGGGVAGFKVTVVLEQASPEAAPRARRPLMRP